MNKKNLWFIYILLISVLLYSCGSDSSQEANDMSVTTTKNPEPTSTSQASKVNLTPTKEIQADVEFNLSTSNKIPPKDILTEISYYVGGGGGGDCPESKPVLLGNNINMEPLTTEYLNSCGWKENEAVLVSIQNPNGDVSTQQIYAGIGEGGYYAKLELRFGLDAPTGVYKFTFEGNSGKAEGKVNLNMPNGVRLFRIDDTHLQLYGFKPLESVDLYYYHQEKFAGWQTYKVNQQGQLVIQTPPTDIERYVDGEPIIPICNSSKSQFFVAVGEESGEVPLPFETCQGTSDNLVIEDSIVWSCGNLKTRLLNHQRVKVSFTDGSNMRIRAYPGFDEKIIDSVPEGTEIYIIGVPACVDNVTWWKISINSTSNAEGWMAEYNNEIYWLEPMLSLTPTATKSACGSINTPESKNVIAIDAPSSFVQELANLDVPYVFYAHKGIGVSKFNDIHGMTIFSPQKNMAKSYEPINIFIFEGNVRVYPDSEKNLNIYEEKLLTNDYIGMMLPSVAEDLGFNQRDDVVQIIFRCSP